MAVENHIPANVAEVVKENGWGPRTQLRRVEYTVQVTPLVHDLAKGMHDGLVASFTQHSRNVADIPSVEDLVYYIDYLLDKRVRIVNGEKFSIDFDQEWLPAVVYQVVAAVGRAIDKDRNIEYVPKRMTTGEYDREKIKEVADFFYFNKDLLPAKLRVDRDPEGVLSAIRFMLLENTLLGESTRQDPAYGLAATFAGFQRVASSINPEIVYAEEYELRRSLYALGWREPKKTGT